MEIPTPTPNSALVTAYTVLGKALADPQFRSQLLKAPDVVLAQESIDDPQLRNQICSLLSAVEQGQVAAQGILDSGLQERNDTLEVVQKMKVGLNQTLNQIDRAFRSTMFMYKVLFYLGVALVIVATVSAFTLQGSPSKLPAIFGSLGTLDMLIFFLKDPQEKIQSSRADLAQLQAALYSWFMDSTNQRTVLGSIMQEKPFDVELFDRVSKIIANSTATTLDLIQTYCEPTSGTKK
jgi:hypothetical protein